MKVKTWIEIEQEVEVEVSIADVMSSIATLADGDQLPMILDCISSCHRTLRSIPDVMIAAMNDKQRDVIYSALHIQAARFAAPPPIALGQTEALVQDK